MSTLVSLPLTEGRENVWVREGHSVGGYHWDQAAKLAIPANVRVTVSNLDLLRTYKF